MIEENQPMYKIFREIFSRYSLEQIREWGERNWPSLSYALYAIEGKNVEVAPEQ